MSSKRKLDKVWCFTASIGGLVLFVVVIAPWLEQNVLTSGQQQILESRELDPTDLFYMESEAALEIYHDLSH